MFHLKFSLKIWNNNSIWEEGPLGASPALPLYPNSTYDLCPIQNGKPHKRFIVSIIILL